MFISILICTLNRSRELARVLSSLLTEDNLCQPDWDITIVDNGSTDSTREICRTFQNRFRDADKVHILVEPKPGKSNALNTGLASIEGDIVALTDDDVLCDPAYLSGIREVFGTTRADAAQGRVLLDFEGGRPAWLDDRSAALLSLRDCGDSIRDWDDNLSGANMILQRSAIDRVGGFSPEIGAGAAGFMEDSEFSQRLRRSGCKIIYAPQILVRHQIGRAQLQKSAFRDRYFRWGRSEAYLTDFPQPLWRLGLYVAKEFVLGHASSVRQFLAGNPDQAFSCRCETFHRAGFLYQHWRFATRRDQPLQPQQIGVVRDNVATPR